MKALNWAAAKGRARRPQRANPLPPLCGHCDAGGQKPPKLRRSSCRAIGEKNINFGLRWSSDRERGARKDRNRVTGGNRGKCGGVQPQNTLNTRKDRQVSRGGQEEFQGNCPGKF